MRTRKLILIIFTVCLITSCRKDEANIHQVRYEFISDVADQYTLQYTSDNPTNLLETVDGTSWTKTVSIRKEEGWAVPTVIGLTVYPPASWKNTSKEGNITLKCFSNGREKFTKKAVLTGSDHDLGIWEITTL